MAAVSSSEDSFYRIEASPKGLCLIINNFEFEKLKKLKSGPADGENLKRTFKTLDFQNRYFENLSSGDMEREMQYIQDTDHSNYDCFVCCINSHGNKKGVCGSDDVIVPVKELQSHIFARKCPSLAGKPKVFFVNACRGNSEHKGIPQPKPASQTRYNIGDKADFLVSYSTTSDNVAWTSGDPSEGSRFVFLLTSLLDNYAESKHLIEILNMVNADLQKTSTERTLQVSELRSTLSKELNIYRRGKPKVTVNQSQISTEGQSTTLVCDVQTCPPLTSIQWYKGGQPLTLTSSNRHYSGGTTGNPSLKIRSVELDDAGSYHCVASNSLGSTQSDTTVLTVYYGKSRHSPETSVDATVEDKTMSPHDSCLKSEKDTYSIVQETAMLTKIRLTSDKDSGHEDNIFVDSTKETKDKTSFPAKDTDKKRRVTTTTQSIDKAVCNKPKESGASAGYKSPPNVESHKSQGCPDSGLVAGSSSDAVPEMYYPVTLLNDSFHQKEPESTHVTSQPTWENDGIDIPPPIVSMCWQFNGTFHSEGGVLRKPGSDVILHVPPKAVNTDSPIVIHTAVCADVDRVHDVLGLSDEEQVVSPLAEYWAGRDFSFERPVCITLPLCLPPDPDLSLLRVYRVSRSQDGYVSVNLVNPKVDDTKDDAQNDAHSNCCYRFLSVSTVTEKEQAPDVTDYAHTSPGDNRPEACALDEEKLDHKEAAFHQDRLISDELAFFPVTSKSQVEVTTDCFSGYGCAYCGPPELIATVNGSLERTSETTFCADVDLYVWDNRIEVSDFREKYKIRIDTTHLQGTVVGLLKEPQNTNFYQRLTVLGPSAQHWTHLRTADGQIGNPVIQERDLESVLSCDADGCSRRRSAPPLLVQWNLMAPAALMSDSTIRMTINLSHVMSGVDPTWKDNGKIERSTSMTFKIPKPVMTQTEMPGEPNAEQWRHLLSVLNTGQLKSVAEVLNVGQSERMHRKCRQDDGHMVPETYMQYMVDMCCRQDAAKVRAAIVALIPQTHPLEQRLTTGHIPLLENGTSHSQQPTDSPDATSGKDDSSCPPSLRRRADMSGDTSATASIWDSSNACVLRDSADSRQPDPSIPDECVAEPCHHDSRTQIVLSVKETCRELTVRGAGVGALAPFASCMPGLPGQASPLALMEPVPDAVFKHVDRSIILCISKMLSSTGAMHFFVDLGLSHDQYNKAMKKQDDPGEAYLECFVLLGRCRNTEINVEKLIKALEEIDRYDIVEEVKQIEKKTMETVSTRE